MTDEDVVEEPKSVPEEDRGIVARMAIGAGLRHAAIAQSFATKTLSDDSWQSMTTTDVLDVFRDKVGTVKEGEMSPAIALLMAQAMTLDTVFTELVKRAGNNMGEYPQAFERYMRLALKAQSNSRVTLEAIGKLARGGEQIVRHIHVDNRGGQAIIAENVAAGGANLLPGGPDALPSEQPHAALPRSTDLRGQDPLGGKLPELAHAERPVSDARREVPWGAAGQPQCPEARSPNGGDDRVGEEAS